MEKRSRRRTRDLVTQAASQGLSENEIGCARISMMARSTNAPCKGRIQMRKTNPLQSIKFGLQRTAGPYKCARREHSPTRRRNPLCHDASQRRLPPIKLGCRPDTQASEQDIPCYEFRYKKGAQVGALEASRDEAAGFEWFTRVHSIGNSASRRGQIANCRPISTTSSLGRWR